MNEFHETGLGFGLSFDYDKVLFNEKSAYQNVTVIDTKAFGKLMLIDNCTMVSDRDEAFYHEQIVHPVMQLFFGRKPWEQPNVLILGGGDGGAAREVFKYDVKKVTLVDIDELVTYASRQFFPNISCSFDDPRMEAHFEDGLEFVKHTDETYDIIIVDSTDPCGPGENLFNEEFYSNLNKILNEGGFIVSQTESPFANPQEFKTVQKILNNVFPVVVPYVGFVPIYPSGIWSWTISTNELFKITNINLDLMLNIQDTCSVFNGDIFSSNFSLPNYVAKLL